MIVVLRYQAQQIMQTLNYSANSMPIIKLSNLIVNHMIKNKLNLPMYTHARSIYLCFLATIITSQGTNASEAQKIIKSDCIIIKIHPPCYDY